MLGRPRLVVLSDDWGRHPSSCQHLVQRMLHRFDVVWINTVGTRAPRLDGYTLQRGGEKLWGWLRGSRRHAHDQDGTSPLVLDPAMWPGYGRSWQRAFNRRRIVNAVRGLPERPESSIGLTTLPTTAALLDAAIADRWVYYCVDDLSRWPGLDRNTLEEMERTLVRRVDAIVAASSVLVERMHELGREATLLTHGVDLEMWSGADPSAAPAALGALPRPRMVFWGVVDRRLDVDWLKQLGHEMQAGSIVLVGPQNQPPTELNQVPRLHRIGPLPYESLPAVGAAAAALIMPYRDLPVTQAMQPLKLKEYLATGRPVVARSLPSVEPWADACDAVSSSEDFTETVLERLDTGELPETQRVARRRLAAESWEEKAAELEECLLTNAVLESSSGRFE